MHPVRSFSAISKAHQFRNKLAPINEKAPDMIKTPQGNIKKDLTPFYSAKMSKLNSSAKS